MKWVLLSTYDAVGGPEKKVLAPDGFWAGPTDAGEYVVAYCGKHRSRRYPDWSSIPWGTHLKDDGTTVFVLLDGKWQNVEHLTRITRALIIDEYRGLYGTAKVPPSWVFNDFGHLTCYIFKDRNRNRRLGAAGGERIHGEFFHTTPVDEARTTLHRSVKLDVSHGCIHLKPLDIDTLVREGYMRKGARVVVHSYADTMIRFPRASHGKAPFELHFFPGLKQLAVIGQRSP
jgi:hypothetical protein